MKKVLIFILCCAFFSICSAENKIDINTATPEQLDEIIEIGPKTAQKIIDARPFSSLDDLLKVSGIGEKTLAKIKEQGLACVDCQTMSHEENFAEKPIEVGLPFFVSYPKGILINEVMASPKGSDEENEWIELYNSNDFEVDISGWKIKDNVGTQTVFIIPNGTKISGLGALAFWRPETRITLNNDGDEVLLLNPNGEAADSLAFGKTAAGQSYKRTSSNQQIKADLAASSLPKREKPVNNNLE